MNEDIKKYETQQLDKLKINDPEEYQRLKYAQKTRNKSRKKKSNKRNVIYVLIVLPLSWINYIFSGPPILYLLFPFFPFILRKLFSKSNYS
tara:strand:- start:702 stop:974 length:273 start_codon:yes stop_codon:yes gene_type:complete